MKCNLRKLSVRNECKMCKLVTVFFECISLHWNSIKHVRRITLVSSNARGRHRVQLPSDKRASCETGSYRASQTRPRRVGTKESSPSHLSALRLQSVHCEAGWSTHCNDEAQEAGRDAGTVDNRTGPGATRYTLLGHNERTLPEEHKCEVPSAGDQGTPCTIVVVQCN